MPAVIPIIARSGTICFDNFLKVFGASPSCESLNNIRLDEYIPEFAPDKAAVKTTKLIILAAAVIPT